MQLQPAFQPGATSPAVILSSKVPAEGDKDAAGEEEEEVESGAAGKKGEGERDTGGMVTRFYLAYDLAGRIVTRMDNVAAHVEVSGVRGKRRGEQSRA